MILVALLMVGVGGITALVGSISSNSQMVIIGGVVGVAGLLAEAVVILIGGIFSWVTKKN